MFGKRVVFLTLLAVFGYVNPAHAITGTLSAGRATNPDTGTADGGTFTTQPYTTTTTFNSGTPTSSSTTSKGTTTTTYTYSPTPPNASAPTLTYTWSTTATTSPTSIKNDQYAPPGPNGQKLNTTSPTNNTSNYMAVFQNSPVTITSSKLLNYIGIDWGYADQYNQIQFYNTNVSTTTPIKTLTSADFFGNPVPSNPEVSSYVDFISNNTSSDFFNQIVLTSTGSTGFETDNYAVRVAPAPSSTCGILALGVMGAWNLYRGNRKAKQRGQGEPGCGGVSRPQNWRSGVRGQGTQA